MPEDILLTKPFVPPLQDMIPLLERIWCSRQLTNGGPVHDEFEMELCNYLHAEYISLFANGTLALMIALRALGLRGEVITTPFTSPATLQAIWWNGLTPVFADISENDLNIDISAIDAAITSRTCAIVPVHLFGNPCNAAAIGAIGERNDLKVIYDAAHCFGVSLGGNPVCNLGDLTVLSFHATKVFNTFEGGAIVCHDAETKARIDSLKNTGIGPDNMLTGYGVNSKMNEIQAAMGLCQLKYIQEIIKGRKSATLKYRELLDGVEGIRVFRDTPGVAHNYAYFPVIISPEEFGADRDVVFSHLAENGITTRKYFFPLVSDFPEFAIYRTTPLTVAGKVASNILCLPLFHDITAAQVERVVACLLEARNIHTRTG